MKEGRKEIWRCHTCNKWYRPINMVQTKEPLVQICTKCFVEKHNK